MVLVVSPRDGWGYSRVPLFVVAEVYLLDLLKQQHGMMESMHGNLHEMGHFWWQLANSSTSDDWINESLAEFFSLYACEKLFGRESANTILKAYVERVRKLKDPKPILGTLRGDQYGYVLYYEKGALIWEMLREKLSDEKLFSILRKYYAAHKNGPPATTQNLIDAFAAATHGETNDFFTEFLKTASLSNLRVNVGNCD
jgi:aminopeptidase N